LRHALAKHLGKKPEQFIFGTGSDGLIELICKTFLAEGDESIVASPSFSLYELNILASGATAVSVPLNGTMACDLPAMAEAITEKTKVIFLCNPNNPTGAHYTKAEQEAFLQAVPQHILVVVDEAYYEYAAEAEDYPDTLSVLEQHPNVVILRTYSKIYGMAGLRIGYGISHPAIISQMEKVRPPFNVCSPAQVAAVAALEDTEFLTRSVSENRENRAFLEQAFDSMGLSCAKSATNFIAVDTKQDSKKVYEALLEKGYIVKGGHVLGMPGYLRVTVGTRAECEGFIAALQAVLQSMKA